MKFAVLIAGLAAALFAGAAPAAAPIVIKFSHVVASDTPKGAAAEFFKERAELLTKGRVRVDVYPNGTLYKDKEELEALQLGAVQMVAPSLAKLGPLGLPEFEVFDLPYLFDNYEQLHKVTQGPIGRSLLDKLDSHRIKGLAYWDNGFKVFSSNKPIRTLDDFRGQKMRIQASRVIEVQMRALGARPEVLPFSDAYQALRDGIVDGTENPPSNLYTQNMHTVQKYVRVSNHGYLGYAVLANKRFWERLPADIRRQLERAMADATEYANRIARQKNAADLKAVSRSGCCEVFVPPAGERKAMRQRLVKLHESMAGRLGVNLVKAIHKETGFDPGQP